MVNEKYEYLERLKALKVWDAQYEIISDNAGGNGNIPARYQDSYQNDSYLFSLTMHPFKIKIET